MQRFNLIKQIHLILDLNMLISDDTVTTYKMINVTTLILKLSISLLQMVMFLAFYPIEFIFLNSFDLLELLVMLLTSTLEINC